MQTFRAREVYKTLGYAEWRNFDGLIKRTINLINTGVIKGKIIETKLKVRTGCGAIRVIKDYLIDRNAFLLIKELASSYKINNFYKIRNETIILNFIKEYCNYRNIDFKFQYQVQRYKYDCLIGNKILVEFDESHHIYNTRQKRIDIDKSKLSRKLSYKLLRISLDMEIIDIIKIIDAEFLNADYLYYHEEGEKMWADDGFARLRSKGDQSLFGGYTTIEMKRKLSVPEKRPLADFLPTITIKAKDLAAEITGFNTKKNDLRGEQVITAEHVKNNRDVRTLLAKSGIKPEELPPEEDIKKLERQIKSEDKRLLKSTRKIEEKQFKG